MKIIIGGVAAIFIISVVVLLKINSTSPPEQSLQELNSQFEDLLKQKTPSWDAFPAAIMWWEAKVAKERSDFDLSQQKLAKAIDLIKPVKKVSYDEILKYAGVLKHPIPKGKLKPPENGAYTGVWQFPILCSPSECPQGGFDQITNSHSALVFFTSSWFSLAPAYDYNFELVMSKVGQFSWDDLFSFENSFILNPTLKKDGRPLVLNYSQEAELLAQYGSVMVLSWIMGYPPANADWAGGKDYHPEKMKGKAPTVKEILNGQWDDYIRKVAKEAKNINAPLLIELTHEFNVPTMLNNAFWSFGANGDKSSFEICDSSLTRDDFMTSIMNNTISSLVLKIKKGEIKADCPELYNQYGSSALPDGPERQRDIWIRVKKIFDKEEVKNVARFEHTGDNFGTGFVNTVLPWNKIDDYWPGDKNIDFIGTSVYYNDAKSADRNRNQADDISTFHAAANLSEAVRNSRYWKNTPVLLLEFASMSAKTEEEDIKRIFCDYLPKDFKNVKGFTFLDSPPSFGAPAEIAAWKQCVSNNPYYVQYPAVEAE